MRDRLEFGTQVQDVAGVAAVKSVPGNRTVVLALDVGEPTTVNFEIPAGLMGSLIAQLTAEAAKLKADVDGALLTPLLLTGASRGVARHQGLPTLVLQIEKTWEIALQASPKTLSQVSLVFQQAGESAEGVQTRPQ